MSEVLGPLPEGDRFADILKFRRLGTGGGDQLYECWGSALLAYAAEQVAAERERCAKVCEDKGPELLRWWGDGQANAACQECATAIRGGLT